MNTQQIFEMTINELRHQIAELQREGFLTETKTWGKGSTKSYLKSALEAHYAQEEESMSTETTATVVAFNKFSDEQANELAAILGRQVNVETRNGFAPGYKYEGDEVTPPAVSTDEFALSAAAGVPADAIVRNSGSSWVSAAIAAALRGRNSVWPRIVAFGSYPFPVNRVEAAQELRELGRERRSNAGETAEGTVVVNLSHPIDDRQKAQIAELVPGPVSYVGIVDSDSPKFHADVEQPLGAQVAQFIDENVELSGNAWQTANVVVNLPGQSELAVLVSAYIEGLRGSPAAILRIDRGLQTGTRTVGEGKVIPTFEFNMTEVVDLQDIRQRAAEAASEEAQQAQREALGKLARLLRDETIDITVEGTVVRLVKRNIISHEFSPVEMVRFTVSAVEFETNES